MKGICECGKRWWQHSEAVKEAATVKWLEQRNDPPQIDPSSVSSKGK